MLHDDRNKLRKTSSNWLTAESILCAFRQPLSPLPPALATLRGRSKDLFLVQFRRGSSLSMPSGKFEFWSGLTQSHAIYILQVSSGHDGNRLPPFFPYPFKRLKGREGDLPRWRLLLFARKRGFARETYCFYYFKRRIMVSSATSVAKWRDKPLCYLLNCLTDIGYIICTGKNTFFFFMRARITITCYSTVMRGSLG